MDGWMGGWLKNQRFCRAEESLSCQHLWCWCQAQLPLILPLKTNQVGDLLLYPHKTWIVRCTYGLQE